MTKIDAKIIPNFCVGLVIEGTANWAVKAITTVTLYNVLKERELGFFLFVICRYFEIHMLLIQIIF